MFWGAPPLNKFGLLLGTMFGIEGALIPEPKGFWDICEISGTVPPFLRYSLVFLIVSLSRLVKSYWRSSWALPDWTACSSSSDCCSSCSSCAGFLRWVALRCRGLTSFAISCPGIGGRLASPPFYLDRLHLKWRSCIAGDWLLNSLQLRRGKNCPNLSTFQRRVWLAISTLTSKYF